ncbi:MAG: ChaN family lipoprotein [Nitrospirae bacterium]|nr:ChaN family lipoprotein [Nitrospirota bacterium]
MKLKSFSIAALISLALITNGASATEHVLRLSDGDVISFEEMIEELKKVDIVFIGENHENEKHHKNEFEIIRALNYKKIPLGLGLEMFTAENQKELDAWVAGKLDLDTFLRVYYKAWRLPWPLYRDIFTYAKDNRIPMIGLNVPAELTNKVSREGFQALTDKELGKLPPEISCNVDEKYMEFVKRAYEAHEIKGKLFVNFCEAQMVWDKSMAWHLIEYMKKNPMRQMIVLSGTGHSWKYGMPVQAKKESIYTFKVILHESPGRLGKDTTTKDDADYLILEN